MSWLRSDKTKEGKDTSGIKFHQGGRCPRKESQRCYSYIEKQSKLSKRYCGYCGREKTGDKCEH